MIQSRRGAPPGAGIPSPTGSIEHRCNPSEPLTNAHRPRPIRDLGKPSDRSRVERELGVREDEHCHGRKSWHAVTDEQKRILSASGIGDSTLPGPTYVHGIDIIQSITHRRGHTATDKLTEEGTREAIS